MPISEPCTSAFQLLKIHRHNLISYTIIIQSPFKYALCFAALNRKKFQLYLIQISNRLHKFGVVRWAGRAVNYVTEDKLFFRFQPVENGGEMWGPREPAGLPSMNVHAG